MYVSHAIGGDEGVDIGSVDQVGSVDGKSVSKSASSRGKQP
jgi:hypothetical protein